MKSIIIKILGSYYNLLSYFSRDYAANKALKLFTTPRKGRIKEKHADFLGTAFKEELNYNKIPVMTYRWLGKKETILLAHGWESNAARWKKLIKKLNHSGYHIVALDAPAHGRSGGKQFNAVLYAEFIAVAAKRFKPSIIIGHSVGGMSTVFFQQKYQLDAIQKLILLGSPSEFTDVISRYTTMLGYNQRITKRLNSIVIERYGKRAEEFSTSKLITELQQKSLIIHDQGDAVIPYNDAVLIHKHAKQSQLITTSGYGHSLNNETISSYIEEFIVTN